jgi:hypothetical protein
LTVSAWLISPIAARLISLIRSRLISAISADKLLAAFPQGWTRVRHRVPFLGCRFHNPIVRWVRPKGHLRGRRGCEKRIIPWGNAA